MDIKVIASSSSGNCYYITDGVTPLLLECGIPFPKIQQATNFGISKLGGVLVTHEHKDHCKALPQMLNNGANVYCSTGTQQALKLPKHYRLHTVKPLEKFSIGTWQILPFDVQHDAAEPMGYLLCSWATGERLLFATDTYYIKYRFEGALDYVMVECNYAMDILNHNIATGKLHPLQKPRLLKSHFEIGNVKAFLRAQNLTQVKAIWLLHLSDGNSNEERFKREIMEITGCPVYIAGKAGN